MRKVSEKVPVFNVIMTVLTFVVLAFLRYALITS